MTAMVDEFRTTPAFFFSAVLTLAVTLGAQTKSAKSTAPGDRPAFEAASVKPNKSAGAHGHSTLNRPGGHVEMYDFTLRQIVGQAFDFSNLSQAHYGIVGMPHWGDSERFDIEAESPDNPTIGQKRLMLQSLLADRFKLLTHRETRTLPVYALVIAKLGQLGPQLRPRTDDGACQQFTIPRPPVPSTGRNTAPPDSPADAARLALQQFPCGRFAGGVLPNGGPNPYWAGARNVTMEAIANSLGGDESIDRQVIDRTGLTGTFDFTIEWNTQQQDLSVNPHPDIAGLSLFEAVSQQLGLKVESEKGPVGVLVIDHVERPSPN